MKHLKSLALGSSVMVFNLGTAFTQIFRFERCTGLCRTCGMSCINPAFGLAGLGVIYMLLKKYKYKLYNKFKGIKLP